MRHALQGVDLTLRSSAKPSGEQHQLCSVKQLVDIIRRLSPGHTKLEIAGDGDQNQENKRQPDARAENVASISCVTEGWPADAVYGANKFAPSLRRK